MNTNTGSATFLKKDTTTQGNWINVYGNQGYDLVSDAVNIPSYASVTLAGQTPYTWTTTSSDVGPPNSGQQQPRGCCMVYDHELHDRINLNDGQAHDIALYASIGPTTDAPSRSRSRAQRPAQSWIRSPSLISAAASISSGR